MIAFVLAQSDHGAMIVNRLDYNRTFNGEYYGVGARILEEGAFDFSEIEMLTMLLRLRQQYHGDGVVALDCGANIGTHTLAFARTMRGWGQVTAVEAQERVFYALAGNIVLHNALNARAIWGAVDRECGHIDIPQPNYTVASSFGSFELKRRLGTENIGQSIDYDTPTSRVFAFSLDSMKMRRCDLIKMDIEGMELDALAGARETIERCKPLLCVECIKVPEHELRNTLEELGYKTFRHTMNLIAAHKTDPTLKHINSGEEAQAA